ncbi:MAG: cupin domain-containing protein [Candidatus Nanopelagicales bacterium]
MPEIISSPAQIPVPGGKTIEEFVGHASSGDTGVSVAHMVAPAGWDEPFQAPTFDEFTVVLEGELLVDHGDETSVVVAGQAIITRAGERIRYRTASGARYVAVCLPAFAPEDAHRDESS